MVITSPAAIKPSSPANPQVPLAATFAVQNPHTGVAANPQSIGFQVGTGHWKTFTSGKQCYVELIKHLVSQYPDFPARFQNAKTRGKRAWISKTKDELFPGRVDFQSSEVTAVGGGWLVGTQMSAHADMPKRVEAACACVGLVFGRDIKANFL